MLLIKRLPRREKRIQRAGKNWKSSLRRPCSHILFSILTGNMQIDDRNRTLRKLKTGALTLHANQPGIDDDTLRGRKDLVTLI